MQPITEYYIPTIEKDSGGKYVYDEYWSVNDGNEDVGSGICLEIEGKILEFCLKLNCMPIGSVCSNSDNSREKFI